MKKRLFISYSHADQPFMLSLKKHLHQYEIDAFADNQILPGEDWYSKIIEKLNTADIILCLLSADFLSSVFVKRVELKRAFDRRESGHSLVVPILIRPVTRLGSPFHEIQCLPKNLKPVELWTNHDVAYQEIAECIYNLLKSLAPDLDPYDQAVGKIEAENPSTIDEYRSHRSKTREISSKKSIPEPDGMKSIPGYAEIIKEIDDRSKTTKDRFKNVPDLMDKYEDWFPLIDDVKLISDILHESDGEFPSISLLGMSNAGKSTILNKLFGVKISKVTRTLDTTDTVFKVRFKSGLIIYDTPGVCGVDEKLDAITRAFLRLRESTAKAPEEIPMKDYESKSKGRKLVPLSEVHSSEKIDLVMIVVDLSNDPLMDLKNSHYSLYQEAMDKYDGRVVVVGNKIDDRKYNLKDRKDPVRIWKETFDNEMIVISAKTGDGLDNLVKAIFRTLGQKKYLETFQQSLIDSKRVSRLSFVISQASGILAGLANLSGRDDEKIKSGIVLMIVTICNQYRVEEEEWDRHYNRMKAVRSEVSAVTKKRITKKRAPRTFLELLQAVFLGREFTDSEIKRTKLGIEGLKVLIPKTCNLIMDLEERRRPARDKVKRAVDRHVPRMRKNLTVKRQVYLAREIGDILDDLLMI